MTDRNDKIGAYKKFCAKPDGENGMEFDIASSAGEHDWDWTALEFEKTDGINSATLVHATNGFVEKSEDVTKLLEDATCNKTLDECLQKRHDAWWEELQQRIHLEKVYAGRERQKYSNLNERLRKVKSDESVFFDRGTGDGKGASTRLEFVCPFMVGKMPPDVRFHYLWDGEVVSTALEKVHNLSGKYEEFHTSFHDLRKQKEFSDYVEGLHEEWGRSCARHGHIKATRILNVGQEPQGMAP